MWAVGAIIYEMFTGEGAFAADNPVAVFYKIVNEPFPSVRVKNPDLPAGVDQVLARACAKQPRDRFHSTSELYRELAAVSVSGGETREVGVRPLLVNAPTRIVAGAAEPTRQHLSPPPRRLKTPPPSAADVVRGQPL